MSDNLNKILNLIKKTGDKVIILNEGEPVLVMMGFKDYEKMVFGKSIFGDLTNERLTDRINKETAFYKEEEKEKEIEAIKPENEPINVIKEEEIADQGYEIEPIK